MNESDLTQLQAWLEPRLKDIDESVFRVEAIMERIEDHMAVLDHALVGLAEKIDIRLREKGATP